MDTNEHEQRHDEDDAPTRPVELGGETVHLRMGLPEMRRFKRLTVSDEWPRGCSILGGELQAYGLDEDSLPLLVFSLVADRKRFQDPEELVEHLHGNNLVPILRTVRELVQVALEGGTGQDLEEQIFGVIVDLEEDLEKPPAEADVDFEPGEWERARKARAMDRIREIVGIDLEGEDVAPVDPREVPASV